MVPLVSATYNPFLTSNVLDLNLLKKLKKGEVNFPDIFNEFMNPNGTYNGRDITMQFYRSNQRVSDTACKTL